MDFSRFEYLMFSDSILSYVLIIIALILSIFLLVLILVNKKIDYIDSLDHTYASMLETQDNIPE